MYSEDVADAVRHALTEAGAAVVERKMFGGLAFMVRGHMVVGVIGNDLMVRVGKDTYADALAQPHAREMDFTGRPMTGIVCVAEPGFRDDRQLQEWVGRGLAYTSTLAAK